MMDPLLDTTIGTQSKRKGMKDILSQEDLHDPWRCLHSTEKDFTFYSNVHSILGSISSSLTELSYKKITDARIHNITWTDHAPISLVINLGQQNSNHVLWRNNTYILPQRKALAVMKERLEEFFKLNDNDAVSISSVWCAHKAYVRGLLIKMASREKKKKITGNMQPTNQNCQNGERT